MVSSECVIIMGMSSVSGIAKAYFSTLADQRTGGVNLGAVITQFIVPATIGIAWSLAGPSISTPGNAIVGISIVSALLCAMATMLFQIRIDLRIRAKEGKESFVTERDLELIDQLFFAVLWAILFGLLVVLVMVASEWFGVFQLVGLPAKIAAGFMVSSIGHFVFVIGTILKRMNRVYEIVAQNKRKG